MMDVFSPNIEHRTPNCLLPGNTPRREDVLVGGGGGGKGGEGVRRDGLVALRRIEHLRDHCYVGGRTHRVNRLPGVEGDGAVNRLLIVERLVPWLGRRVLPVVPRRFRQRLDDVDTDILC